MRKGGKRRHANRRLSAWYAMLILSSAAGCVWVEYRQLHTGSEVYRFLYWNLFLAWIPFCAATALYKLWYRRRKDGVPLGSAAIGILWLLFLPNAPYLATDLLHFSYIRGQGVWPWSDLFMILTFVWTGLMLGFLSIYMIHERLAERYGFLWGWCFIAFLLPINALGVFVGRELRWNSWDVLTHPWLLLPDLAVFTERSPYVFIAMVTVFCGLGYLMIYSLLHGPFHQPGRQEDMT